MKKIICTLILIFPLLAISQVIYVTPTGAGLKDGTSWDNAMDGVQNALDNAPANSEIWVKAGIYQIPDETNLNAKPLKLYGGFIGTETSTDQRDYKNNTTTLTNQSSTPTLLIKNILNGYFIFDGFSVSCFDAENCICNIIVRNCNLMGFYVDAFDKLILNNNIINGLGIGQRGGLLINSYSGSYTYSKLYINNNLIYNINQLVCGALDIQLQSISAGQNVIIANNTICNNGKQWDYVNDAVGISLLLENYSITGTFLVQNNLFYNNIFKGQVRNTNFQSSLQYCAFDGGTASGNNINLTSNPFVGPTDFSIPIGSPCINTGTSDTTGLYLAQTDLAGKNRIVNGRIDIGSYEYTPYNTNFTYQNTCALSPTQFTITNSSNVQSVSWDFGDGQFSPELNPLHNYIIPGIYNIKLTITYTDSYQQIINRKINILKKPSTFSIMHQ